MSKVCIVNCYTCYECALQENTVYDLYMRNAIDMALGMSISGYRFQQYMFFYHDENSKEILEGHSSNNNKRTLYNNNSQDKHFPTFGCM
mgnify:CR=1 FL=1